MFPAAPAMEARLPPAPRSAAIPRREGSSFCPPSSFIGRKAYGGGAFALYLIAHWLRKRKRARLGAPPALPAFPPPRIIRCGALLGGRSQPLPRSHWRRAPVPPRSSRLPARGVGERAGRDAEEAGAACASGPRAAQHGMRMSRGSLFPTGGGAWSRGGRRWVRGAGEVRSGARRGRGAKPRSVPGGSGAAAPGWRSRAGPLRAPRSEFPGEAVSRAEGRSRFWPQERAVTSPRVTGFLISVTAHWNGLPVESPSLEIFRSRLDTILCRVL